MKRIIPLVLFSLLIAVSASAETRWGVRVGVADGEPMVGGEVLFPIGAGFVVNPNIEFTRDLFSANADVHYDFSINATTDFWVGAGLAFVNPDEGSVDGGVNILAGLGQRRGSIYPYAQLKFTSADHIDYASAAVGLRF